MRASMRKSGAAHFIPPWPLLFGQGMLLLSWIALFAGASSGPAALSPLSLVWIHAVVLGWLTTTSLAFMIHVLPGFTDVRWRLEPLARGAIVALLPGTVVLVLGFALWRPLLLSIGGTIVVASLLAFGSAFLATTIAALQGGDRATRAIARAFSVVIGALVVAAVLGLFMAVAIALGHGESMRFAPLHGTIGVIGWIALLVAGVSTRTFNRLIGRADRRGAHTMTSVTALAGFLLWIAGSLSLNSFLEVAGGVGLVAAGLFYAGSTLWALHNASARHRLPREFLFASMVWLVVTALLGSANLAGFDLSAPMLYALLIGWVGQTVNAHLMHTGIRLLATIVICQDDETQPMEMLDRRLGVVCLYANQTAVFCGVLGLTIGSGTLVQLAAVSGIGAMAVMAANVIHAIGAARQRPIEIRV